MFFYKLDKPVFYPKEESNSFILKITEGCAYNKCTFCKMYKDIKFKELQLEEIQNQINLAKPLAKKIKSIFLVDANCFDINTHNLVEILKLCVEMFPNIERISAYATIRSLVNIPEELFKVLTEYKLTRLYIGVESGDDNILRSINKGNTVKDILSVIKKLKKYNIEVYINVINELPEETQSSIIKTEQLVTTIKPDRVEYLTYYK